MLTRQTRAELVQPIGALAQDATVQRTKPGYGLLAVGRAPDLARDRALVARKTRLLVAQRTQRLNERAHERSDERRHVQVDAECGGT